MLRTPRAPLVGESTYPILDQRKIKRTTCPPTRLLMERHELGAFHQFCTVFVICDTVPDSDLAMPEARLINVQEGYGHEAKYCHSSRRVRSNVD